VSVFFPLWVAMQDVLSEKRALSKKRRECVCASARGSFVRSFGVAGGICQVVVTLYRSEETWRMAAADCASSLASEANASVVLTSKGSDSSVEKALKAGVSENKSSSSKRRGRGSQSRRKDKAGTSSVLLENATKSNASVATVDSDDSRQESIKFDCSGAVVRLLFLLLSFIFPGEVVKKKSW